MSHQNRVSPRGDLLAVSSRGTLTGNRGVLHDGEGQIVRRAQVRRWISCRLEFRGWQRAVMAPNRYTHLFFLDEATALAAGHRPCATCRHDDFNRFRACWAQVGGAAGLPAAQSIDDVLHRERGLVAGRRTTRRMPTGSLPDGVFVEWQDDLWLLRSPGQTLSPGRTPSPGQTLSPGQTPSSPGQALHPREQPQLGHAELLRWTPAGYTDRRPAPPGDLVVLTPPSVVAVLSAGYRPEPHPTALP